MKVIGVSGFAKAGKDTFVAIAKDILTKNGYIPYRIAFADKLKDEISHMLKNNGFKVDIFNMTPEQKEQIRSLMVWWGCQRRYDSVGGLYWVDEADHKIQEIIHDTQTAGESTDRMAVLVSDVRFPNEANWIHEKWGGEVIHLKRYVISQFNESKLYDFAPNEEEAKQDPLVESMSDVTTEWEGKGYKSISEAAVEQDLKKVVLDALNVTRCFNDTLTL